MARPSPPSAACCHGGIVAFDDAWTWPRRRARHGIARWSPARIASPHRLTCGVEAGHRPPEEAGARRAKSRHRLAARAVATPWCGPLQCPGRHGAISVLSAFDHFAEDCARRAEAENPRMLSISSNATSARRCRCCCWARGPSRCITDGNSSACPRARPALRAAARARRFPAVRHRDARLSVPAACAR